MSEEEIEIEVEEEVEVEVEEEDEEPDDKKEKIHEKEKEKEKEKNEIPASMRKSEKRKSILKRVSGDFRKDILLRASLSDKSNPNFMDFHKSAKNVGEFKSDDPPIKMKSQPIPDNIKEEKEIKDEDNNNNDTNNTINELKTKEEEENIVKIQNIIGNNEIEKLLESKKWEDKKLGLIKLNEFIERSSDIIKNFDIFINYIKYKLNDFKETNFNIVKEGMKCFCSIFNKIGKNEGLDKKYSEIILNGLNEKIGEPKLKEVYIELLNSLMNSYSEKIIVDILLSLLENCKKVAVLKEYAEFIDIIIDEKLFKVDLNIKGIIDFLVNLANNSNSQLRALSTKVICHLYKYIGPDLKLLIKNIKESTLKNIYKELEKIDEEKTKDSKEKTINDNNKINSNDNNQKTNKTNSTIKSDISKLIPPKLLKEIDKGKWQEKKEGIDYIIKTIENGKKKILPDGLNNLFDLIQEKLSDANKNFVRMIIQLLSMLITSLGENIKVYSKEFIKPLLLNLSDKNQLLREDCFDCINKLIENQNFEIVANYLPHITGIENSDMRKEILNLLTLNIDSLLKDNYSESFYKELTKSLISFLQDKSSKIKIKAEEFIIKFKDKLKKENYLKEIEKYKPSIAKDLKNIINRLFPNENSMKQVQKEKSKILSKNNTAKKENISKNNINKNIPFKKIDLTKKPKVNNNSKNIKKELLKDINSNSNNKSLIINTPKRNNNISNSKNTLKKSIIQLDDEKKIMNKTVSNWKKPILKKENSLILGNKKSEKNKINKNNQKMIIKDEKKRPKLNLDNINSKNNTSNRYERAITDSNQKLFKLSKEKPIKTERNDVNHTNIIKKDNFIKKIPSNKNNPITGVRRTNRKNVSSLNNSIQEQKNLKKNINTNSNKKENKNDKKANDGILSYEELTNILKNLLNNEKDRSSPILKVYNLIYKNFNINKELLLKNSDIIFQTFIDLVKKLFSYEKTDIKILKYVTNVLCKISGIKELINTISSQTHINLINIIFAFVLYEEKNRLEEDEEGIIIWKSFNSIMLHIIDYCNFSENICILIQLIKFNIKENTLKLSEYGSRCLTIINQTIKDIYNKLNINEIFKEIHLFLIEFEINHPDLEYNNKKEKNIVESIRGLIIELAKAKKDSIIDDYNKLGENFGKEDKYILKWIKDEINRIKEEEREKELKLNIDADIENLISEELLTNI